MIVTWWGSRIECASALSRLERERRLGRAGLGRSMEDPERLDLVSSDDRLSQAASREGFTVL